MDRDFFNYFQEVTAMASFKKIQVGIYMEIKCMMAEYPKQW
jgi:hypothetical protein